MNKEVVSIIIFIVSYVLFIFLPNRRTLIALSASFLLLISGTVSLMEAVQCINWNVMGIFVGTLFVADGFMKSRVPAYIAELIVDKTKNTCQAILGLCIITGFISAFVENVATVLIIAPIALSVSKRLNFNPTKMLIAIAISSNLQGTATLIGDSPSMILAGFAKMNFLDFFFYRGKPGIFFAVELGAISSFVVLYFIFRKHTQKVLLIPIEKIKSWFPTLLVIIMILSLVLASFFDTGFPYKSGVICIFFGIITILFKKFGFKENIVKGIKSLDWETTFFLVGIFVLVGSITVTGWIDKIAIFFSHIVGNNLFLGYSLLVFISVFFSAFVDNIPFLAAMLPVAISMSERLNLEPSLFMFGLLIGSCLGGNITPIGASANIVACGLLKKEGYNIKFKDFIKIGLPFTLVAVITAYLFIWFVWN